MKAYLLKYKGEVVPWELCEKDTHDCESSDCCYSGPVHVNAGLPVYDSIPKLLSVLKFSDWTMTRRYTATKHESGYDTVSIDEFESRIPDAYMLKDDVLLRSIETELGLTVHEIEI